MEHAVCGGCAHYRQHYTFDGRKIFQVHCGHCTLRKVKKKLPNAKGCDDYVTATALEQRFVSKEFLSKALLQHVLEMDLLPEILQEEDTEKSE